VFSIDIAEDVNGGPLEHIRSSCWFSTINIYNAVWSM